MKARCISGKMVQGLSALQRGATVSSSLFALGQSTGSSGTATVSGSGSTWTNLVFCFVGQDGDGTLNITDGATVSDSDALVGGSSTGVVIVDGAGSSWVHPAPLPSAGTQALRAHSQSLMAAMCSPAGRRHIRERNRLNTGSSGTVNVSGAGSSWMNKGPLAISDVGGGGTLHITSGGVVSNGNCILGTFDGSGNVTVEGVDSTWTINGDLSVGVFLEAPER